MNFKRQFIHKITVKDTKVYLKTRNISFMKWVVLWWHVRHVLNILKFSRYCWPKIGGWIPITEIDKYHKSRIFFIYWKSRFRSLNRKKKWWDSPKGNRPYSPWHMCIWNSAWHLTCNMSAQLSLLFPTSHIRT